MAGPVNFLDLRPGLYRHEIRLADKSHGRPLEDGTTQWGGFPTSVFVPVGKVGNADRVMFLCPKCFADNGGEKGTHRIATSPAGALQTRSAGTMTRANRCAGRSAASA